MPERFVSEAISPVTGTADTARMAIGEPGLPSEFVWRGRTISVTSVLRKALGPHVRTTFGQHSAQVTPALASAELGYNMSICS